MLAKNANVKYRIDINAIEAGQQDDPMGNEKKKKNNEVINNVARDTPVEEPRRSLRNKSNPKYTSGEYVDGGDEEDGFEMNDKGDGD